MSNQADNPVSLGENSRIFINGAMMVFVQGQVKVDPNEIRAGSNISGGYAERSRGGEQTMEVTGTAQWRITQNVLTEPPQLDPGNDVENVYVYPDFTNDPTTFYLMPVAFVGAQSMMIQGRQGEITYDIMLSNQGEFFTPGRPA